MNETDVAEDLSSVVDLLFSQLTMVQREICCQENGRELRMLRVTYSYHMTLTVAWHGLNCEAFCGYTSSWTACETWRNEQQTTQTVSIPQNVLKIKMHAVTTYFCRSLLFHIKIMQS